MLEVVLLFARSETGQKAPWSGFGLAVFLFPLPDVRVGEQYGGTSLPCQTRKRRGWEAMFAK